MRTLERNFYRLFGGLFVLAELEEFAGLEAEGASDDIRRELFERILQFLHHTVVEAARRLNFVFRVGEFALKFNEIRIRFEVGVRLGNRKQRLERSRQHILGLRVLSYRLRAHRFRARFGHFLQSTRFMLRVAFYRLDEIGAEVVSSLELYIDVRPCLLGPVGEPHKAVVCDDGPHGDYRDDGKQNIGCIHTGQYSTKQFCNALRGLHFYRRLARNGGSTGRCTENGERGRRRERGRRSLAIGNARPYLRAVGSRYGALRRSDTRPREGRYSVYRHGTRIRDDGDDGSEHRRSLRWWCLCGRRRCRPYSSRRGILRYRSWRPLCKWNSVDKRVVVTTRREWRPRGDRLDDKGVSAGN